MGGNGGGEGRGGEEDRGAFSVRWFGLGDVGSFDCVGGG